MQPLWLPQLSAFVLHVYGSLDGLKARLPGGAIVPYPGREGVHVLLERGTNSLQMLIRRGPSNRGRLVIDVPEDAGALKLQGRLVERLVALGSVAASAPRRERRGASRAIFVLRSLDGWRAGKSQREIASILFGVGRVQREWPEGQLRDTVRRAIGRGRCLMDGGYLAFLRRSPRSVASR